MPIIGFLGVIVEILSYLDMVSALICASVSVSEDSLLRSRLFSFGLIISYTQVPRAVAFYCLLTQAEPSLLVQEKQMPPSVSLVFLLDSLFHIPKKDATKHSLRDIFLCSLIISLR
mgnify:CR=1 FL=1